jgi:hypothetical protein
MSPKPISGLWYLAALLLAAIGWNVGVAVAGGAWDQVRDAPITSGNQPMDARGSSVAVFTDALQADFASQCSWSSGAAGRPQRMSPAPLPLTVDDDGRTWQLIAFEPEGRDAMEVRCHPTRGRTGNAQYAYAVVNGFNDRAMIGNAITLGSLFVAFIVVIGVFILRRAR